MKQINWKHTLAMSHVASIQANSKKDVWNHLELDDKLYLHQLLSLDGLSTQWWIHSSFQNMIQTESGCHNKQVSFTRGWLEWIIKLTPRSPYHWFINPDTLLNEEILKWRLQPLDLTCVFFNEILPPTFPNVGGWTHQPIWKMCEPSNWVTSQGIGVGHLEGIP